MLTHTVGWAKKDGEYINTKVYVTNISDKKVTFVGRYKLTCYDNEDKIVPNIFPLPGTALEYGYEIPPNETNIINCRFKLKSADVERLNNKRISDMHFEIEPIYEEK